jgi:putative oxidoreductase
MNALIIFGPLAARILIALIFVMSGFGKITGFEGTVGNIASKGLPMPELLAIGAIIVELGGGIMLIVGWNARWAAAAIFYLPQWLCCSSIISGPCRLTKHKSR